MRWQERRPRTSGIARIQPQVSRATTCAAALGSAAESTAPVVTLKLAVDKNGAVDDLGLTAKRFTSPESLDAGKEPTRPLATDGHARSTLLTRCGCSAQVTARQRRSARGRGHSRAR